MDSWSPQQLKMMQSGGNDALNRFLAVRCTHACAVLPRAPCSVRLAEPFTPTRGTPTLV
jgi:hypothetical protein